MKVLCVDRRPLEDAGARWVNGVPGWMFDESDVPRPTGDELIGAGHAFHLVAGHGPERVVLRGLDLLEVDMRLLVARLQQMARDAGAELRGGVRVRKFDGTRLDTGDGEIRARWYVDASGLAGARLLWQPPVDRRDVCAAGMEVRATRDAAAARAFFRKNEVTPGDTLCFSGIAGGYSIVNVRMLDDERISILTGSIPADGWPSGHDLVQQFATEHAWVGDLIFGGQRALPLRRPYDRIALGPVALLGDAGCQVFSAHGSGIGAGMLAAKLLADALAAGRSPHSWAVAWMREHGATHAAYEVFRKLSQDLAPDEVHTLIGHGLLEEHSVRASLEQRMPRPRARTLPGQIAGAVRAPRLAARLARALAKMVQVRVHYQRYPEDRAALPQWSRETARLFDDKPDPVPDKGLLPEG
jgi:flavin-dependent dehydrogenase